MSWVAAARTSTRGRRGITSGTPGRRRRRFSPPPRRRRPPLPPLPPPNGCARASRCKTSRRTKFLLPHADQLYDALQKEHQEGPPPPRPVDEDLPGLGQHYCNISGCVLAWRWRLRPALRATPPASACACQRSHSLVTAPRGVSGCAVGSSSAPTCLHPLYNRTRPCVLASLPPCRRFFQSAEALAAFRATKAYKRLVKRRAEQPHTQADADAAAGMGRPHNG